MSEVASHKNSQTPRGQRQSEPERASANSPEDAPFLQPPAPPRPAFLVPRSFRRQMSGLISPNVGCAEHFVLEQSPFTLIQVNGPRLKREDFGRDPYSGALVRRSCQKPSREMTVKMQEDRPSQQRRAGLIYPALLCCRRRQRSEPSRGVVPGRCEASNPESRDSGAGPSDHPGMTSDGFVAEPLTGRAFARPVRR